MYASCTVCQTRDDFKSGGAEQNRHSPSISCYKILLVLMNRVRELPVDPHDSNCPR